MAQPQTEIARFFNSHDFSRGLLMTITMVLVGAAFYFLGFDKLIVGVCLGVLLTTFNDVQGSYKHRNIAMYLSIGINSCIIGIVNCIHTQFGLLIVFIGITSFLLSMLMVYGARASFLLLSSLLALVLSLVRFYEGSAILIYIGVYALGGLVYILVSNVYHSITKKRQAKERLGELAGLTSDYFKIIVRIARKEISEEEIQVHRLDLQQQIALKQEAVRDLLMQKTRGNGPSNTRKRQTLILIELIDIMELVISNPNSLLSLDEGALNNKRLYDSKLKVLEDVSQRLIHATKVLLDNKPSKSKSSSEYLKEVRTQINNYIEEVGLPKVRPVAMQLRNYHHYLERLTQKISSLERLVDRSYQETTILSVTNERNQFLTRENYSPRRLKSHLSLKSPIFRHALRLSIAMIAGYAIGTYFDVKNAYWILLTTVVIMRPSFGLTKSRSFQRVMGTLLGVAIAVIIVYFFNSKTLFLLLAIVSNVFAFALFARNYLAAATAVTLNVIFVFSLLQPDVWNVIQYRVIDTSIGAAISLGVSYIIFPFWEYKAFPSMFGSALEANKNYLLEIGKFYMNHQSDVDLRLARKEALLQAANLNAALQRLAQDPKSKQKDYDNHYRLITLNDTMLATLASMGTFFRNHHATDSSDPIVKMTNALAGQVDAIKKLIEKQESTSLAQEKEIYYKALNELKEHWNTLEQKRDDEIANGKLKIDPEFRLKLQEVRFIVEEFNWFSKVANKVEKEVLKLNI